MKLAKAYTYLGDVVEHKQVIPFRRYSGGVGRASQAKQFKTTQGRWPEKSVKFITRLLKNAESNADAKSLELEELIIKNIVVQQAPVCFNKPLSYDQALTPRSLRKLVVALTVHMVALTLTRATLVTLK